MSCTTRNEHEELVNETALPYNVRSKAKNRAALDRSTSAGNVAASQEVPELATRVKMMENIPAVNQMKRPGAPWNVETATKKSKNNSLKYTPSNNVAMDTKTR